jgi:cell wall assembly regulator SMI1
MIADEAARIAVQEAWERLTRAVAGVAPECLAHVGPPASEAAIAAAERALGHRLPADFRAFVALHDGVADAGPVPVEIASLEAIVRKHALFREMLTEASLSEGVGDPDPGVQPRWLSPAWIPVVDFGTGEHYCLDLGPAPGGTVGQLIWYRHEYDQRHKIADSFTAYLDALADALARGELVATEDEPGSASPRLMYREDLTGSLADLYIRGEAATARSARLRAQIAESAAETAMRLVDGLQQDQLITVGPQGMNPFPAMAVAEVLERTHRSLLAEAKAVLAALRASPDLARVEVEETQLVFALRKIRNLGEG